MIDLHLNTLWESFSPENKKNQEKLEKIHNGTDFALSIKNQTY